ncbi:TetR/AcrR family transcriptional regulator [Kribbella sp. NPDC048928]|uniref:TetR/AcrR family transcriptional regulator n=1 Tax=Kribbella sp. NPDC048928 TaxID=3364111 RepID=UPI00371F0BD0
MTTTEGTNPELERSLTLLWSGRAKGRRGPRAQLSVERIAQAAVDIADADGLEALSMQRIAKELGFSPMSLYNHVPNKEMLLEVAADIGAGAPPDLTGITDFRQAVRQWVEKLWTGLQLRPWMMRVPLDHASLGPHQMAWLEQLMRHLVAAGLAGRQASVAALHLTAVVRGTAQISVNLTTNRKTDAGIPRPVADVAHLVAGYLDPEQFPALSGVLAAETGADDAELEQTAGDGLPFELSFGVDRFLDGVEAWVARGNRRD